MYKLNENSNQIMVTRIIDNNFLGYISHTGNETFHKNNDDSAVIISHPDNQNLRLFAVADGTSDALYGTNGAEYLTSELASWFQTLPVSYINTMPTLKSVFWGKMREINKDLLEKYNGKAGTTLVCAITGEKETLIANSGDSRGYIVSQGDLKQVTADHLMWFKYNDPDSILKDDLRFMKGNSYISRSIGTSEDNFRPDVTIVSNDDYEALLLFTDGITDIVSDDKIKFIYDKNRPAEALLKIINEAVNSGPEYISEEARKRFANRMHQINDFTVPGKDNATMLLFKKANDRQR